MAVNARFFSAHSAGAPPAARSHAACSTPLYFAESTQYLPHSTRVLRGKYNPTLRNAFPVFRPAALPRRGQPSGQRGRAPYPPHKKNQDTNPFPAWRPQETPNHPKQPHAPLGTNHLSRSVSVTNPLPGIRSTPAPPLLRPQEAHVRFATAPKMPCRNNSETRYYDYWPKMSHEKPKTPFKTFTECLILRKKS